MMNLAPFSIEHFSVLSSWFASEKDVVQWGGPLLSFPVSPHQLRGMLNEARLEPPSRLCWMVETVEGNMVGHAQLGFDWRNGIALLSRVAVAPEARGRGLASEMVRLVVGRAFDFQEIERVELNVYTWNEPAIRTYQRIGFQAEGVRRSSAHVAGERWDTAIMGLLRSEWSG